MTTTQSDTPEDKTAEIEIKAAAETPETEVATTPAPSPRPSRVDAVAIVVSTLALVVGGFALVRPYLTPPSPAVVVPATLDRRLAPLEAAATALKETNAGMESLSREVEKLRSAPAPEAPAVDTFGLEAAAKRAEAAETAVAELTARVQSLEEALKSRTEGSRGAEAGALAAGLLRRAAEGERPFVAESRLARALVGDDADSARLLDEVAPRAETGVPTTAVLAERFRALETPIVRAARAQAGGDWWNRALANVSSLVVARRVEGAEEGSVDAIVEAIDTALKSGDAPRAADEAAKLAEAPAKVAASWLADLKARAALDRAADGLSRRALERLATALGVEIKQ